MCVKIFILQGNLRSICSKHIRPQPSRLGLRSLQPNGARQTEIKLLWRTVLLSSACTCVHAVSTHVQWAQWN